jgi:proteasome lid subunit RPN8/RPN11
MRKLLVPKHVYAEIVDSVSETARGLETGVTLFGTSLEGIRDSAEGHIVLAIAGPGKRATHEPAHYSGDQSYANAVYAALRSAMPSIRWIGEIHVHPRGMTWLSSGDRRTVKEILTGNDDTLHPDEFIAGVMQRRNGAVDIYPYHFTREWLTGSAMELALVESNAPIVHQARLKGVQNDRPSLRTESAGSREAVHKTPRHRWLRQRWERLRQHGRKGRDRQVHSG